jgi:hypothetical protein
MITKLKFLKFKRAWWQFENVLFQGLQFGQCKSEICFPKRNLDEVDVIFKMYVDDCIVKCEKAEVQKTMEEIGNHFVIKRSQEIKDFIG